MKIPESTLRQLQDAIIPLDTIESAVSVYKAGDFLSSRSHVKDINMRYRWDLYYDAMRRNADQALKDET